MGIHCRDPRYLQDSERKRLQEDDTFGFNVAFDNGKRGADGGVIEKDYYHWQLDTSEQAPCRMPAASDNVTNMSRYDGAYCCGRPGGAGGVGINVAPYCNTTLFAQIKLVD